MAFLALLVAPGVCVDVDDVAVLSEAVDERTEAWCVSEYGRPLLEREVRRDHDGTLLVPAADDVEEQVCGAGAVFLP